MSDAEIVKGEHVLATKYSDGDPGADAFLERIKRLGREPINLAEKVTR